MDDSPATQPPNEATTPADVVVDARGLNCPMPVIELAKAMRDLDVGATVRLLATDSTAKVDVPVWCRMQRQGLEEADVLDAVTPVEFHFLVRKVVAAK